MLRHNHVYLGNITSVMCTCLPWKYTFLRLGYCKFVSYHIEAETNGRHFPDDIFKCIFLNENVLISIKISLKFVPKGQINNIPALG